MTNILSNRIFQVAVAATVLVAGVMVFASTSTETDEVENTTAETSDTKSEANVETVSSEGTNEAAVEEATVNTSPEATDASNDNTEDASTEE